MTNGRIRWSGFVLAAAFAVCARADDAPPVTADAGLGEARQDYQAIKAAGRPTVQQSLDLPKIPVPTLPSTAETAPPPPAETRVPDPNRRGGGKPKDATHSKNWLVDALMAPDAATPGADDDADPDETGSLLRADGRNRETVIRSGEPGERVPRSKVAPEAAARGAEKSELAVVNPLESYLASWMTPADRSLLLRGPRGTVPAGDLDSDPRTRAGPASGVSGDQMPVGPPGAPARSAVDSFAAPADNPFLELLVPDRPGASDFLLTPATPAPAPVVAPLPPPGPAPSVRPADALQDQFRARDEDDRAFKQLKRF